MTAFDRLNLTFPPMEERTAAYIEALCRTIPITDALFLSPTEILRHVAGVLRAVTAFDWNIPQEIIYDWVLPYRVNDEVYEPYNDVFFSELFPFLQGLTMEQAALVVNRWCLSKATYQSTDDRTMGPLSVYHSGFGRCGEESVFTVCALRSVGIPARQCYVPFWAHCDDNHAWVEVYIDGRWRFLGACEPEETLDIGWFNHAASKAPIVRHRRLGHSASPMTADQNQLFDTGVTTSLYAETATLTVAAGVGASVGVYVINYCRPSLLTQKTCGADGAVKFTLGQGCYLIIAGEEGAYDGAQVTLQEDCKLTLDLCRCPGHIDFDLIPAHGHLPPHTPKSSRSHLEKVQAATQARLAAHKNGYHNPAIAAFEQDTTYTSAQKERLLRRLSAKDLRDVSYEVLMDAASSFAQQGQECDGFFDQFILCPRVEQEPLFPHRAYVRQYLSNLSSPQQVWSHLLLNSRTVDSLAYPGLCGSLEGALTHRVVTSHTLPIHYVQICRALGYAARLNPIDRSPEFFNGSTFVSLFTEDDKNHTLTFQKETTMPLYFGQDVSLCSFTNGAFLPLKFEGSLETVPVKEGIYAVTHALRQIDGSVTGTLYFVPSNSTVSLKPIADKTAQKLLHADLTFCGIDLSGRCLLAFIEASSEPTEHFLNELLENRKKLEGVRVVLLSESPARNATLDRVLKEGLAIFSQTQYTQIDPLRDCMGIGDHRLPFITAAKDGIGLFSFANYNVGTVSTLLNLLK